MAKNHVSDWQLPPTIKNLGSNRVWSMRLGREPLRGWPAGFPAATTDLYKPTGHGPGTEDFLELMFSEGSQELAALPA